MNKKFNYYVDGELIDNKEITKALTENYDWDSRISNIETGNQESRYVNISKWADTGDTDLYIYSVADDNILFDRIRITSRIK